MVLATKLNLKHRPLNVGLEMIDFQLEDPIGRQLEAIFTDVQNDIQRGAIVKRQDLYARGYDKLLSEVLFKRFGLKSRFNFVDGLAAIMPFFANRHHIFLDPWFRGMDFSLPDQDKLLKTFDKKEGSVDLKRVKLTGIFSEYEHEIYLDLFGMITQLRMPVNEITGILLHECGHGFTFYEFADRLESTNQILSHLAFELKAKNNPEKRTYIYRELSRELMNEEHGLDDLINEDNRVIIGMKLFKVMFKSVQSQLKNSTYDKTASEQMADNFAARFGYGRDVIMGLDRLYKAWPTPETDSSLAINSYIFEILNNLLMLRVFLGAGIIGVLVGVVLYAFICWISGDAYRDFTYDDLKIRYKRIRHQYIDMIQTLKLDNKKLSEIIESIDEIDRVINRIRVFRGINAKIGNFLFGSNRDAKSDIELQQLLEDLVHNDLYLRSAELKTLD